jgi:hypothetical protein
MWETCFAGLHTEHCWRCSIGSNKCQQLLEMTLLGQAGSLVSCLPNLGHFCIVGWSHQKGKWRQTHINSALSCLVRRESQSKQGQNVWNTFCLLSYFAKLDFSYERERERERERDLDLDQLITINMNLGQSMFHSEDLYLTNPQT